LSWKTARSTSVPTSNVHVMLRLPSEPALDVK